MTANVDYLPLNPSDATLEIQRRAKEDDLTIFYTMHTKERLIEREITISDVLYVLKNGTVFDEGTETTQRECHNYKSFCRSPNSSREIGVVVIMDSRMNGSCEIKIKTVMWIDEPQAYGTIVNNPN